MTDGFVAQFTGGKVRVRLEDEWTWLTVKGAQAGLARSSPMRKPCRRWSAPPA
ncbi:hypothetical protein [Methylobacterium sp. C1]|uniref:hypothetical protein n=1 Tax=Methylobacterium sp. C1 TaxID=1479019 RepID=UPI0018FE941C|nr:hypothetical protein [Methylobacterium sp. C1]